MGTLILIGTEKKPNIMKKRERGGETITLFIKCLSTSLEGKKKG